ncbi:MAG: hypothetical protein KDK99_15440 [Verrucomicrobiales bacterium]|nr:hypothetical protein [Verrucomicrobiales bacterium]
MRRLHRHPCGVIYTQEFADHLAALQREEAAEHDGDVLSIDYIRCASGPQAGSEWYQLSWITPPHNVQRDQFLLGSTWVHLHPQTRRALKRRCLHFDGSRVIVRA